ncbi:hypothetical protein WG66_011295 [Moniliophthora roreri]|nr:hypothetical protein WG66_011295 [Moniliophthora roreri]
MSVDAAAQEINNCTFVEKKKTGSSLCFPSCATGNQKFPYMIHSLLSCHSQVLLVKASLLQVPEYATPDTGEEAKRLRETIFHDRPTHKEERNRRLPSSRILFSRFQLMLYPGIRRFERTEDETFRSMENILTLDLSAQLRLQATWSEKRFRPTDEAKVIFPSSTDHALPNSKFLAVRAACAKALHKNSIS